MTQASGSGELSLEAQRQQRLLHTLWQQAPEVALSAWLGDAPERQARGLRAYRANAQATAARALAAAFPTVAALLCDETFNAVAARHWQLHPPERGDLAQFGTAFASALADDPQLSDLPYLADVARLDWAVHHCAMAADPPGSVAGPEHQPQLGGIGLGQQPQAGNCPGVSAAMAQWCTAQSSRATSAR